MARFSVGLMDDIDPATLVETTAVLDSEYGYDTVFVSDHLHENVYALLALLADATERIGLGTGVTNPYTRHPAVTAAAIATIDRLSDGRATLGLGAGSPMDCAPLGFEQAQPIGTVRDAIRAIRTLHRGETVSMQREEFELHDASLDGPPADVPIYVGGRGPQILTLAGYRADGVLAGSGLVSPEGMEYAMEHIESGARNADRDPAGIDVVCWAKFSVADDSATAVDAVNPIIAKIVAATPMVALRAAGIDPADAKRVKALDDVDSLTSAELRSHVSTDLTRRFAIAGTPGECRTQLAELQDAGVSHVGLLTFENDDNDHLTCLERFWTDVLPDR